MDRWLVTGGAGLVGRRLLEALTDLHVPTRALVHRRDACAAETVHGDLCDPAVRIHAVKDVTVVVHCAAELDRRAPATRVDAVNHLATVGLARAAADAGADVFVFLSSLAAVGSGSGGPIDESTACRPADAYGESKRAAEQALLGADLGPTRLVILRPPTVYGPGEHRGFLALARGAARGVFPLPGRGDARVALCHVDNLVEAIRFVAAEPRARGVLHVADDPPPTLRHVIRTLSGAAGREAWTVSVPMGAARLAARALARAWRPTGRRPPIDPERLALLAGDHPLDTSRIRTLGFVAPVPFEAGAKETVARYVAEGLL